MPQPTIETMMHSRALPVAAVKPTDTTPGTLDEETRSVEVVGATENPVETIDWDRWEMVPEVLLMSGCQLPDNRQAPLLDSHSRYSTSSVIGSYREMRIENGQLIGRAHFAKVPEVESTWAKVRDGHLTDFSVGYRVLEKTYIPPDTTGIVAGRSYEGPVNVVTSWKPREMSACPIGADEAAKARAALTPEPQKENSMNPELRKFLESRGLVATATDDEARAFAETLAVREEQKPQPAAPAVDADAIRAEAGRAERSRIASIRAMCDKVGYPADKAQAFIDSGASYEAARAEIHDYVIERAAVNNVYRGPIDMGADEVDKFRSAAIDAISLRSGQAVEKPAPGALDLRGFSLHEMARECLRAAGRPHAGSVMEMVGRALTTSDFPNILANTANRFLLTGYGVQAESWQAWCDTGSVADFKQNTLVRASETSDLDQVAEDDEFRYGKRDEAKEAYQIATYGKLFRISRQAIINDDLGALTDIPLKHGEAAARKVGDIAYAVLTANANMGDGTALFHSDHGNLAGTGAVISAASIGAGVAAMRKQKDISGLQRLNIAPQYLIVPAALEGVAKIFLNTNLIGSTANAGQPNLVNPYFQLYQLVVDARLDDNSATAWYLAGPKGKTVRVFFLNGNQTPYMETKQGFDVDGIEYKVRIDAGAKAVDWRGLYKQPGA